MGTRTWATFGNILKIFALLTTLVSVATLYRTVEYAQAHGVTDLVLIAGAFGVGSLLIAALFWLAKGPLVAGNSLVRLLVGLYMLFWLVSTLGFALVVMVFVYVFTAEPESYKGTFNRPKPAPPRFAPPSNWRPTGRVGPSGAMLYSDAEQASSVGIFDSGIPVQVMEKRNGLAQVVAATGERGWIDQRQLFEAV